MPSIAVGEIFIIIRIMKNIALLKAILFSN